MIREQRGYGNPVLDEQFAHESLLSHTKRVRSIRGCLGSQSIDFHKINNQKKWFLEECRIQQIEHDNRKLFAKIHGIAKTRQRNDESV